MGVNSSNPSFDGKHAVVIGGASGIGAAAVNMLRADGAAVTVLDVRASDVDGVETIETDLRDEASIEAALSRLAAPCEVLLGCAGIATDGLDLAAVNFVGQRHVVERAIELGLLGRGSSVGMVSSTAGLTWESNLAVLDGLLATESFSAGMGWFGSDPSRATYRVTKQAVSAYVARRAFPFAQIGLRINAVQPGQTDTPLARANSALWLDGWERQYRDAAGLDTPASPADQAGPLLFLCSDAAGRVNGANLVVDAGYHASAVAGVYDAAGIRERIAIMRYEAGGT